MSPLHQTSGITEAVLGHLAADCAPRFREVMTGLLRNLHVAVREVDLHPDGW